MIVVLRAWRENVDPLGPVLGGPARRNAVGRQRVLRAAVQPDDGLLIGRERERIRQSVDGAGTPGRYRTAT